MGRPVVAAAECVSAIDAKADEGLVAASSVTEYLGAIDGLLNDVARATAMGERGRACVLRGYSWEAHLAAIDAHLPGAEATILGRRAEGTV